MRGESVFEQCEDVVERNRELDEHVLRLADANDDKVERTAALVYFVPSYVTATTSRSYTGSIHNLMHLDIHEHQRTSARTMFSKQFSSSNSMWRDVSATI